MDSLLSLAGRALLLRARLLVLERSLASGGVWLCAGAASAGAFFCALGVLLYFLLEPLLGSQGAAAALAAFFLVFSVGAAFAVRHEWRRAMGAFKIPSADIIARTVVGAAVSEEAVSEKRRPNGKGDHQDLTQLATVAALGVIASLWEAHQRRPRA